MSLTRGGAKLIKVQNLSKTYQTKTKKGFFSSAKAEIQAVKDLSLEIPKGKITGLLGLNGAGKTTTIKMLTTILEPTSGKIYYDGEDINQNIKAIRGKINMIAGGERNLYWRLTAKENLEYFGALYHIPKDQLKKRIDELLAIVGLSASKDIPVERFSKGMKQRLQIAKGLINDPEYIFLDEPTLGLDIQIAKELRLYIKDIAQKFNKGVLLTTHYLGEVEELCDYMYIIGDGSLVAEGTTEHIISQIDKKNIYVITIRDDKKGGLATFEIEHPSVIMMNDGEQKDLRIEIDNNVAPLQEVIESLVKLNMLIIDVQQKKMNLEEALLKLQKRLEVG